MMIFGHTVDRETRCIHYRGTRDIIAIKFRCCGKYYPCYKCHDECESHETGKWKAHEFDEKAILCGVCDTQHTITEYMDTGRCKNCDSEFNQNCRLHHHLYFDIGR